MQKLRFSVFRYTPNSIAVNAGNVAIRDANRQASKPAHHALWSLVDENSLDKQPVGAGEGTYFSKNTDVVISANSALCLHFELVHSNNKPVTQHESSCVARQEFEWPDNKAVLRLDQVTFPAGAIAWRHTHKGAGFRHLVNGELRIEGDHDTQNMMAGDSWFEDANSPVRAVAGIRGYTQFIRAMIIPVEYEGKSTIQILDPEDVVKPTLQKNHRFLDQVIEL